MSLVLHDHRPTILLVEDSPDEEMLIMRAIRRSTLPCQVLIAHNTDEAIDFLFARGPFEKRESRNPDVVVTDLKISSIGGAELITEIRGNPKTRLIPIVVLTSSASSAQIDDLYRRGANSFLEKPMDFDEFSNTIARIASYWGTLNTGPIIRNRTGSFPYPL